MITNLDHFYFNMCVGSHRAEYHLMAVWSKHMTMRSTAPLEATIAQEGTKNRNKKDMVADVKGEPLL